MTTPGSLHGLLEGVATLGGLALGALAAIATIIAEPAFWLGGQPPASAAPLAGTQSYGSLVAPLAALVAAFLVARWLARRGWFMRLAVTTVCAWFGVLLVLFLATNTFWFIVNGPTGTP